MTTLADDTIPPRTSGLVASGNFHHPFMEALHINGSTLSSGVAWLVAIHGYAARGLPRRVHFPLFTVGTALGTATPDKMARVSPWQLFPPCSLEVTFASGLNTAITRTPLATPLILTGLSGRGRLWPVPAKVPAWR
jgi:hypothetical protein